MAFKSPLRLSQAHRRRREAAMGFLPGNAVFANALVGYWAMEEDAGNNRVDSHGSDDLTEFDGTVARAAGKQGYGADFEWAGAYLKKNWPHNQTFCEGSFTLAGWLKAESLESIPGYNMIMYQGTSTFGGFNIKLAFNDLLACQLILDDAPFWVTVHGNPAGTGSFIDNWNHFAAVHDVNAHTWAVYINGGLESLVGYGEVAIAFREQPFAVGCRANGSDDWFDGVLDELCTFNDALSLAQIQWLYNAGAGRIYTELMAYRG